MGHSRSEEDDIFDTEVWIDMKWLITWEQHTGSLGALELQFFYLDFRPFNLRKG
jgi:hypothetical protein